MGDELMDQVWSELLQAIQSKDQALFMEALRSMIYHIDSAEDSEG